MRNRDHADRCTFEMSEYALRVNSNKNVTEGAGFWTVHSIDNVTGRTSLLSFFSFGPDLLVPWIGVIISLWVSVRTYPQAASLAMGGLKRQERRRAGGCLFGGLSGPTSVLAFDRSAAEDGEGWSWST